MRKLMKAEMYRIIHSKKLLRYLVIATILCILLPFKFFLDYLDDDLSTMLRSSSMIFFMILMLLPPFYAYVTGKLYNKGKLGMYEVMAGNSAFRITGSKLLTDGLLFTVLLTVSVSIFYIAMAVNNGTGTLDHVFIRFLLYIVLFAQTVFCSVLIALYVRKTATGAVLCYARFMIFDSAVLPFLMWLAGSVLGFEKLSLHIAHLSLINKMLMLTADPLNAMMILHILLGFVFEVLFWYALIYLGMKEKKYR